LCLQGGVAPDDVAAGFRLEIPWRNDHRVVFPDPDSALHLTSDTAETVVNICTFHQDFVIAEKLSHGFKDLTGA